MAYSLKVLEKGTADTIDASIAPNNLYGSESSGYVAARGTLAYQAAAHTHTVVGSGANTTSEFNYTTAHAYAENNKLFFRCKAKVSDATDSIRLIVYGTTSGAQVLYTQATPTADTWYDLHVVGTLTGLVGNLLLSVQMLDADDTTTGVTMTVKDWVAIDLTDDQGAGNESSDADMYAYVLWREDGWEWIDWYRYATGLDHCFRWERIDAHGLTTGDMRHDISATPAALGEWSPVYVIDDDWVAVGHIWALGTSAGDAIDVYKQTDRTSRLLAQSLRLNLRSDIEAEVTCDMYGDATWQPLCGMTVIIYDGTELLHTGKITSISRRRYEGAQAWKCSVRIGTMSEVLVRATYDLTNLLDNYSTRGAIERLLLYSVNGSPSGGYGSGLGILHGRIDLGLADIGEFNQEGKNVSQMITELSTAAGLVWYVDKYRKLHVRTPLVTPSDAAHALVDGNGYTDYREVEYAQATDQYRTTQLVTGDYEDNGDPVVARRSLDGLSLTPPISVDVEACGNIYTAIARNPSLQSNDDAGTSADAHLYMYGSQIPCTISFESGSTDWRPNTKLTVHLDHLGITSDTYFNVDSVELYDIDGVHIRSRVTASQRDGTSFASVPNGGSSEYLANLQTAAQASVGALKQDVGTFTPELAGADTAGTFTYTRQVGYYIRIGNLVWIHARLSVDTVADSPAGNIEVRGLPFDSASLTNASGYVCACLVSGIPWPASCTGVSASVIANSNYALLYGLYSNGAFSNLQINSIATGDEVDITGCYQIGAGGSSGTGGSTTPPGTGSGDVVGPASAVSGNFASFNGVTGKVIMDSGSKAADFAAASHTHITEDAEVLLDILLNGGDGTIIPAIDELLNGG